MSRSSSFWKLPGDIAGASALEFALVGPLLISLLIGIAEFGRVVTTEILLQGAARDASRYGATGSVIPGQPPLSEAARETQIKNIIARETAGLVDMTKLGIAMTAYGDFSDIGNSPGQKGAGGSDDVVLYTLTYDQPLITSLFAGLVKMGAIHHQASVVVRNEPFDAGN